RWPSGGSPAHGIGDADHGAARTCGAALTVNSCATQGSYRVPTKKARRSHAMGPRCDPSETRLWTRQGPLKAGHVRDMGSVQAIIDHVMESAPKGGPSLDLGDGRHSLELKVIAVHGSEDLLAGARRTFDVIQHERGPALVR